MNDHYLITRITVLMSRQEAEILCNVAIYEPWILEKIEDMDFLEEFAWTEFDGNELADLASALQALVMDVGSSLLLSQFIERVQLLRFKYECYLEEKNL